MLELLQQHFESDNFTIVVPHDVPVFNEDSESAFFGRIEKYQEMIKTADCVVIASPEYNHSFSGVIKNFIDWTSRPYGNSTWKNVPVLVISASPGDHGGSAGREALESVLKYLGATPGQEKISIGNANKKLQSSEGKSDEQRKIIDLIGSAVRKHVSNN
jgi:chromate reductase